MNKQDLTLLTDLYELTMMQGYYKKGQHERIRSLAPAGAVSLLAEGNGCGSHKFKRERFDS